MLRRWTDFFFYFPEQDCILRVACIARSFRLSLYYFLTYCTISIAASCGMIKEAAFQDWDTTNIHELHLPISLISLLFPIFPIVGALRLSVPEIVSTVLYPIFLYLSIHCTFGHIYRLARMRRFSAQQCAYTLLPILFLTCLASLCILYFTATRLVFTVLLVHRSHCKTRS
jgi:hypothetical protein